MEISSAHTGISDPKNTTSPSPDPTGCRPGATSLFRIFHFPLSGAARASGHALTQLRAAAKPFPLQTRSKELLLSSAPCFLAPGTGLIPWKSTSDTSQPSAPLLLSQLCSCRALRDFTHSSLRFSLPQKVTQFLFPNLTPSPGFRSGLRSRLPPQPSSPQPFLFHLPHEVRASPPTPQVENSTWSTLPPTERSGGAPAPRWELGAAAPGLLLGI